MGDFIGLVAVTLIFGTPIAGIVSHTYLKAKRLAAEQKNKGLSPEEIAAIAKLRDENAELKARIGNLEEIVNSQPLLSDTFYTDNRRFNQTKSRYLDEQKIV